MTGSSETDGATPLLVIGCGNWFGGDDRAGLEIVRSLEQANDPGFLCSLLPQRPFDLVELLPSAGKVIFVDAVSTGSQPGDVFLSRIPSAKIEPRALAGVSGHGWNLGEIVDLLSALGEPLPLMYLIGVELSVVAPSDHLSEPVAGSVRFVADHFAELAERCREIRSSDIVRVDH